jgi:hypothetical protein
VAGNTRTLFSREKHKFATGALLHKIEPDEAIGIWSCTHGIYRSTSLSHCSDIDDLEELSSCHHVAWQYILLSQRAKVLPRTALPVITVAYYQETICC